MALEIEDVIRKKNATWGLHLTNKKNWVNEMEIARILKGYDYLTFN